jgi:alpha-galactosidase
MIEIDQDERGIAAFKMSMPDSLELWIKPLKNNELALCFFNRTGSAKNLNLNWSDLNISDSLSGLDIHFDQQKFKLRDVWLKTETGLSDKKLQREIASHDVLVFRLMPVSKN